MFSLQQKDSILPCIFSVIDQRQQQNTAVRTKKWHTTSYQACNWCSSTTFSGLCDLYPRTDMQGHEISFLIWWKAKCSEWWCCQQCICPSLDHWYKPVKMDGCIIQVIEKSQWCKKKRDNYTVNSLNACPSTQFSTNDTPCLNIQ